MKIAARYADSWNVYSSRGLTLEQAVAEAHERIATEAPPRLRALGGSSA
jgi:hypothetical protein